MHYVTTLPSYIFLSDEKPDDAQHRPKHVVSITF